MLEEATPTARPTPPFRRRWVRLLILFGLLVAGNAFALPNLVELVTAQPTVLHVGKCEPDSKGGENCSVTWTVDGHHGHRTLGDLGPDRTIAGWATSYDATDSRFKWYIIPSLMCVFDAGVVNALWEVLILLNRKRRGLPSSITATALYDPIRSPASRALLIVAPALLSAFGLLTGLVVGTQIIETLYRSSEASLAARWAAVVAFPLGGVLLNGLAVLRVLRLRPA